MSDLMQTTGIDGQYKVIACQLKTHWLSPGVWSHYVWEIKNGRFKLHNHDVCPSAYVGSFVKHATGSVVVNVTAGMLDMTPDGGEFAGKTLKGVFKYDDSGQIMSLVLAFPGHERAATYAADLGQVYETWQRLETANGSLFM